MSTLKKDTGIVNIHGKEYKTVAKRVDEFRTKWNQELAITTTLISIDEKTVVMKAEITDRKGFLIATGYAEESRTASQINKTSALENCETSAIGRALANFGLAGGEYASADEVAQAISQQEKTERVRKNGIDFDGIKETLEAIDDIEGIDAYAKEIKDKYKTLTEKQAYVIKTLFDNRRDDLK